MGTNGKINTLEMSKLIKEVAISAKELNDHSKQILLQQAMKLEQAPTAQGGGRAILERPFPDNLIKSRKGYNGNSLSYVETVHYIERLNEVFSYQWDWQVTDFSILETEVYCKGKLTVEINGKTITKEGFGGKEITLVDVYDKETRKVIGKKNLSIGDDLKSAGSDALKKACSLLGIGLHLYKNKPVNRN